LIRVLIADDHPVFRYGVRALLESEDDIEIVGQAADGAQAIELAKNLSPDILLMDINMPGVNGIEATRQILQANPAIGVLVITMFDDDSLFAAMRAGARGYLLKGAEGEEILRGIRAVTNGEAIFSPAVARRLTTFFDSRSGQPSTTPFPELTEREVQVLHLIAAGLTNATIAERLVISPKTVRNHVSAIFGKLQVADRAEAIIRAREAGLG
jgi:DNA-binding NarL/FixJ family response regulator